MNMVIKFDHSAGVYELFTETGEWIGAYDSWDEAQAVRREMEVPAKAAMKTEHERVMRGRQISEVA